MDRKRGWPAWTLTIVGAVCVLAGCGEDDFANEPRPAVAKELTGVIQDSGVSVSPSKEGAGPFLITISNQTKEPHTVTLEGGEVREMVGPIQPRDTGAIQQTLAARHLRGEGGLAPRGRARDPAGGAHGGRGPQVLQRRTAASLAA